jgi:pimeloyl-ACP methyl ester carboxylesterase
MTDTPETHYARSADGTNLAYQVSGDGSREVMFHNAGGFPIDLLSEDPGFVRVRRRLDSFSRTVWSDARGLGASEDNSRDSVAGETADADIAAVLDAVGFERPALLGGDSSGLRAIHFSATHPERISALVLVNSFAHYVQEEDYPWGIPPDDLDGIVSAFRQTWGTPLALVEVSAPSRMADEHFRAWAARSMRFSGGPDQVADLIRANLEIDLRPLLPSISVPTLVLHREGNRYIRLLAP